VYLYNASQVYEIVSQRKRAAKFFFSSRFRSRVVKQKALFLHVAKRNRALFFCNPVTGHMILLLEVQKHTKVNLKYYISNDNYKSIEDPLIFLILNRADLVAWRRH